MSPHSNCKPCFIHYIPENHCTMTWTLGKRNIYSPDTLSYLHHMWKLLAWMKVDHLCHYWASLFFMLLLDSRDKKSQIETIEKAKVVAFVNPAKPKPWWMVSTFLIFKTILIFKTSLLSILSWDTCEDNVSTSSF